MGDSHARIQFEKVWHDQPTNLPAYIPKGVGARDEIIDFKALGGDIGSKEDKVGNSDNWKRRKDLSFWRNPGTKPKRREEFIRVIILIHD